MNKVLLTLMVLITSVTLSGCEEKENWTLMICEWPHDTGGCGDVKYTLNGYPSQRECMEKGIQMKDENGFECGSNCELSDGGLLQVCDKVCNERGCN